MKFVRSFINVLKFTKLKLKTNSLLQQYINREKALEIWVKQNKVTFHYTAELWSLSHLARRAWDNTTLVCSSSTFVLWNSSTFILWNTSLLYEVKRLQKKQTGSFCLQGKKKACACGCSPSFHQQEVARYFAYNR